MNILRLRRKGKRIKFKRYLLLLFTMIMTTFAWFAYSKVLDTDLSLNLISWDIKFIVNGEEKQNPMNLTIQELYPGMGERVANVKIQNNGQATTKIQYTIDEISILGETYTIVSSQDQVTSDKHLYVESVWTNEDGNAMQYLVNDSERFPFTIYIESTAEIAPETEGFLNVTVSWTGDNDELDTKWGYNTGKYYNTVASAAQPIKLDFMIYAIQKDV